MATISANTIVYLDVGTTRTAGETWTINQGSSLIIRTDTRWHQRAPAAMTGSIGTINGSALGTATVHIDGTKVRWMPFVNGAGVVPTFNTAITQGDVTGILLGVWADYTSAPTAVGAAMPTTGYLKFLEVTGGQFAAGALAGITCDAASPDVNGWIEVVFDAGTNHALNTSGKLKATGEWFYLDNTNGTRGQTLSVPTNGGGSTTQVHGIQIETAPGSGVYEWWFTAIPAQGWTAATLTTDARAKVVENVGNGVIRIGSDGTNNIAHVPEAGCKVRIPNILGRTCATTARATNLTTTTATSTRCNWLAHGYWELDKIMLEWNSVLTNCASVKVTNACWDTYNFFPTNNFSPVEVSDTLFNMINGPRTNHIGTTATSYGGFFKRCKAMSSTFTTTNDMLIEDCEFTYPRTKIAAGLISLSSCENITIKNAKLRGGSITLSGSSNVTITNTDFIDRLSGDTTSTSPSNVFSVTTGRNVLIDGLTFGDNDRFTNTQCYDPILTTTSLTGMVTMRNIGSRLTPLNCGSSATLYPSYIANISGVTGAVRLQRIYVSGVRTAPITGLSASSSNQIQNITIQHVYAMSSFASSFTIASSSTYITGFGVTPSTAQNQGVTGTKWVDFFTGDTAGQIFFIGNPPSRANASYHYFDPSASATAGYNAQNTLILPTAGDTYYSEMESFVKGHTSFKNMLTKYGSSGSTGATSLRIEYQLDTGDGYSGVWKTMTGPNLAGEVIDPVVGFKMKIKIVALANGTTTNQITVLRLDTNSTAEAQANSLQALDVTTLSFEGLQPGSEVRAYVGDINDPAGAVEIGGVESTIGGTWSFTHTAAGQAGYIMIFAMGYQPVIIPRTYQATDSSLLIQQVIDRNYNNPA